MSGPNQNWLHKLASRRDDGRYPCLRDVFPLTLRGRVWSAVTDSKGSLAVDDGGALVTRRPPAEGHGQIAAILEQAFAGQPRDVRTVRLHDLKAWLPEPSPAADDPPVGVVGRMMVDTALLQHFLQPELLTLDDVPDPICRLGNVSPTGNKEDQPYSILIVAGKWRLFLMAMARDDGPHPIYLPRLGALWHARHTAAGRERIADFYAESGETDYAAHVRSNPFSW